MCAAVRILSRVSLVKEQTCSGCLPSVGKGLNMNMHDLVLAYKEKILFFSSHGRLGNLCEKLTTALTEL